MNRIVTLGAASHYRRKAAELRREAIRLGSEIAREKLELLADRWDERAAMAEAEPS